MSLSNMSTEELKAKRKETSHKISELNSLLREIDELDRERKKEELKKYVGKCYAVRPHDAPLSSAPYKYTKIVEVPVEQYTMTSTIFNENQLPAFSFWVKDQNNILNLKNHFRRQSFDEREFGLDSETAFLGAVNKSRILYNDDSYEEITPEEFNKAFQKHLKCLYNAVISI